MSELGLCACRVEVQRQDLRHVHDQCASLVPREERGYIIPCKEVLMTEKIHDLDYVLAGRLADMVGAVGDVEVHGTEMTFPMRDNEGSIVSFSIDVRGLADEVEANSSDAVVAMGNSRGRQHAALALIANRILEDHHEDWDTSSSDEVEHRIDDYEPIVIDMENFPSKRRN